MLPPALRCWLIGSDSLLVECGDILLQAGHEVLGVVTRTERIAQWARARDLPTVDPTADFGAELARRPFEHLFAITHFSVLPEAILRLPTCGAINFHDGPLPDYAGLNAPAWALINGEERYGVSWHAMTSEVDAGEIVKQLHFDIAPDETSLSLNAKCFEAAIGSFSELVAELAQHKLSGEPQDTRQRRYFERHRRPAEACALDWTRSAEELERLVRALDFGPYPNPLGSPKLLRGGRVLAVTRAQARPDEVGGAPGTLVSVSQDEVVVATGAGTLALSGFSELDGRALSIAQVVRELGLEAGAALETLAPSDAARLEALDKRASRAEPFWRERVAELDPLSLPIASANSTANARPAAAELPVQVPADFLARFPERSGADLLAVAFCAYLSRLARRRSFDVGYHDLELRGEAAGLEAWVDSRLPLRVEIQPQEDLAASLKRFETALADLRRRGPRMRDAVARYPELRALRGLDGEQALPVLVECCERFAEPTLPAGTEWSLEIAAGSAGSALECRSVYDSRRISAQQAQSLQQGFQAFLASLTARPESPLSAHDVVGAEERLRQIEQWNPTELEQPSSLCVHELIEEQVRRSPEAAAVVCAGETLTYAELDARAELLAGELRELGVERGQLVGICIERSLDLVVAILGTLKSGAAYVPLDPAFPAERLAFMVEDAQLGVILTHERLTGLLPARGARILPLDSEWTRIAAVAETRRSERAAAEPSDLAYVIYTSGSTGRPKGVMVEHRNVTSFFAAIDPHVPHALPATWLALTSPSFDISVLELLWTLARGFKVVVDTGNERARRAQPRPRRELDFSLFYFSSDEGTDRSKSYRLLLEGARFADAHGFRAVWTPERHFHAFGGLYPNPAVTGAALAAITRNVQIRAGSVVLPLHHPIRVAEEWALVDNLSGGRVGISFASGWQPNDFVLAPHNKADAKQVMLRDIEVVRRLWRGEAVAFPGPDGDPVEVRTLPRPVQPELPVWITSAGNVETYEAAGRIGANVLTHLLGQSVEQLAPKIAAYREARARAGFDPESGSVALMLHTFVGQDEQEVREKVREPLERYLASSLSLIKDHPWAFPAFKRPQGAAGDMDKGLPEIAEDERAALLAHARERYYETSGLFGTPERCLEMVERLRAIGVDELACLIDFGVPVDDVLASLPSLDRVRRLARNQGTQESSEEDGSIWSRIRADSVTHIQCTPSMARILCSNEPTRQALRGVKHLFVGGEALPRDLANDLTAAVGGTLTNMYGPTEATIWSSTHEVAAGAGPVPLGRPMANTSFYVLDEELQPLPIGVAGELFIGGNGVARGYLRRPELDAERFLPDPFAKADSARMYRTGDLVRYRADGLLEFLGRTDLQIKVRGHRIEPGEIESVLVGAANPGKEIAEAVVVARQDTPDDQRLLAYIVPRGPAPDPARLRERLKAHLPEYMLPAQFVFLERFPRTPNGKIDRRALPLPEAQARGSANVAPPVNDLELRLTQIWQETLGLSQVGVEDNFFDIGGHSLLVLRIHRRLSEFSAKPLSLTDLFRFPTIRSLALHLSSDGGQCVLDEASLRGQRRRRAVQRNKTTPVMG
jgi:natural product biosynthesis luciferase-like monooxygenase protein